MAQMGGTKRPHVVVLGAGFGGLRAARSLRRQPVDVTLIRPTQPPSVPAAPLPGRNGRVESERHRGANPPHRAGRQHSGADG